MRPATATVKPLARQPFESIEGRLPGVGAALLLVQLARVVVERDAQRQPFPETPLQFEQLRLQALHRPHRVGQHQHAEAAREACLEHGEHVRVHERLAAGEADLLGRQAVARDLVEIARISASVR